MELTELLNSVNVIQVMGEVQRKDVSGIYYDSRRVTKGSIFVAIKGFNSNGHSYIQDAINNGALAVILEDNVIPDQIFTHFLVAKILVENSRKALAELSNYFYKESSKKLNLVGITGTNGKTTTSFFIKNILESTGKKTGLLGTIANYIDDQELKSNLTTPESNDLNELFLTMVESGCTNAVMEVSSHSLSLHRVHKVDFKGAVFTNITSDHLDFHSTFENYFDAKKMLFDNLNEDAFIVYNIDDPNGEAIIKDSKAKKFSYGKSDKAEYRITNIHFSLEGTNFDIINNGKTYSIFTKLVGEFNAYNAAAAFASCMNLGLTIDEIIIGIKNTPQVPGRFEVIGVGKKKAIVDYSHTADSLEKCLQAIREIVKDNQKVYTVFGCGGNRDRSKRPIMGKIAEKYSDKIIVTSDNPRFENPIEIIDEIIEGMSKNTYQVIENREEAIKEAITNSEDDAVIIIAGKGHEDYQDVKGVKSFLSDKKIAEELLR